MHIDMLKDDRRRKNIRVAWMLAAFAAFLAVTSVPFWQGLYRMAMVTGQ